MPLVHGTKQLSQAMLVNLSHLLKPTIRQVSWFIRSSNSWYSAIKNTSSRHEALHLYSQMHRQSVPFDSFSIVFALKSCTHLENLTVIRQLHAHIIKIGFNFHVYVGTTLLHAYVITLFDDACVLFDEMPDKNTVTCNTMITGYSMFGNVDRARLVFEEMPVRDLTSWSAMIAGYISSGNGQRGLSLCREMVVSSQLKPDQVTLASILSWCPQMGSGVALGKSIHGFAARNTWELNVELGNALLNMYAKCGFLKDASRVFTLMQERNVMSWTSLICGSAQHCYGREALSIFHMMQEVGVRPNELTFTGILNACAQTGLVVEGMKYFSMMKEYGLEPRIQHYGCIVDLFGKAGQLNEAYKFINTMRLEPNVVVWSSFLSACKVHKQFEMAERVIGQILRMVMPENDRGVYTLIYDLYVLSEKWDDAERVRRLMVNQNAKAIHSSFRRV